MATYDLFGTAAFEAIQYLRKQISQKSLSVVNVFLM